MIATRQKNVQIKWWNVADLRSKAGTTKVLSQWVTVKLKRFVNLGSSNRRSLISCENSCILLFSIVGTRLSILGNIPFKIQIHSLRSSYFSTESQSVVGWEWSYNNIPISINELTWRIRRTVATIRSNTLFQNRKWRRKHEPSRRLPSCRQPSSVYLPMIVRPCVRIQPDPRNIRAKAWVNESKMFHWHAVWWSRAVLLV